MSAFMPVREDLVEKYGNEFGGSADKQVYNGPFGVTEYANGKVELAKNPDYYDNEKISLDGVEILTVPIRLPLFRCSMQASWIWQRFQPSWQRSMRQDTVLLQRRRRLCGTEPPE